MRACYPKGVVKVDEPQSVSTDFLIYWGGMNTCAFAKDLFSTWSDVAEVGYLYFSLASLFTLLFVSVPPFKLFPLFFGACFRYAHLPYVYIVITDGVLGHQLMCNSQTTNQLNQGERQDVRAMLRYRCTFCAKSSLIQGLLRILNARK